MQALLVDSLHCRSRAQQPKHHDEHGSSLSRCPPCFEIRALLVTAHAKSRFKSFSYRPRLKRSSCANGLLPAAVPAAALTQPERWPERPTPARALAKQVGEPHREPLGSAPWMASRTSALRSTSCSATVDESLGVGYNLRNLSCVAGGAPTTAC